MNKHIAISVLGKDRPGIVSAISKVLFETGCNIEDSSMTIIESEFAMILVIALGKRTSLAELKNKLFSVCKSMSLTVSVRELSSKEALKEKQSKNMHIISVYGSDKTVFPSNKKAGEINSMLQDIAESLDVKIVVKPVEIAKL
ncbi:MAG: amino acid-binding protein [Elusimicrobia bacterium]|nr:amino acid-binding protein [Elusimicrobiota bacterium]